MFTRNLTVLLPLYTALAGLMAVLTAPATAATQITDTIRGRVDGDDGVSDPVANALTAGLIALAVVAFVAVVRAFMMNEANNLPSSGG